MVKIKILRLPRATSQLSSRLSDKNRELSELRRKNEKITGQNEEMFREINKNIQANEQNRICHIKKWKRDLISNELADFLGKPEGSEMARTEVTHEITKYIQANRLQNGRYINPDEKLKSLLQLKKGEELTYFNLQRYMSPHFVKANI